MNIHLIYRYSPSPVPTHSHQRPRPPALAPVGLPVHRGLQITDASTQSLARVCANPHGW